MSITSVEVPGENVTINSATVKWLTETGEEATLDKVRYGFAGGNLDSETPEIANPNASTLHVIVIEGLLENRDYICQPVSKLGRNELPCTAPLCTVPFKTKAKPLPGQVTGLTAVADRTVIKPNEFARITLTAVGTGGSIAGLPITCAILNGEPGGDPRGSFDPTNPVVGPDPGNVCEVKFYGLHNGKAKLQFKSGNVDAKIDIEVKP